MDKKQTSPELLQAELLPTQEEQVLANPPSRKRQIDSGSDIGDKPQLRRARLTRKNLIRFTKMGKDKKKESKKSSSSHRDSTSESQKTKTTSTTTSGFADQAFKNGILPSRHSKPPANLKDMQERHGKSRTSVSPTGSEFKRYSNKVGRAPNESTMVVETTRRIIKDYDEEDYHQSFNQSFTGFPKDVGFNDGLSAAQPDYVEGLEKAVYGPFPIDEYIPGAVLYEDDPDSLALPHLAGEYKARGKNMEEARLQSSYDGAALVYARNQALSYMGRSDPPGLAKVTTFTTDGTTLNQYAHYAEESEDGTTKYHQYRIKSTNLIDSHQEFRDGRRGLRNAQDYAKDQSYALRDDLREYWKQQRSTL
ncbi:heterokaryon incompatibility [Fusarium albosuccineum]|uniref:Heterokaryon incompatibility n=1 Tax=Fusarium albosuccineum TaxID=1237068 RepID=A0A8H4LKH6_9HYPO|nr:heterokaryon incompatibility [Fusarium albosuccineum]